MSIVGLESQLRQEQQVLAEREERIARYTRFFSSPHAAEIAAMGKPSVKQRRGNLITLRTKSN